jgi:Integral membrane protein
MNQIVDGAVLYSAELRPHRSAAPRAAKTIVLIVATIWAAIALSFASLGAWPVLPFLGLEILLLWVFFRLNHRAAGACEAIALTTKALTVRRTDPWGKRSQVSFPPHWLQVNLEPHPNQDNRLELRSHGRSLVIGSFLLPHEREQLALALRGALGRLTNPV